MSKKEPGTTDRRARGPKSFDMASDTVGRSGSQKAKKTTSAKTRKPKTIEVTPKLVLQSEEAVNSNHDRPFAEIDQLTPPPAGMTEGKGFGWGKIAMGSFSLLFAIGIGLAIDGLIRDLFARNDWFGWAALAITAVGVVALLVIAIKELWGIFSLRSLENYRKRASDAVSMNDLSKARSVTREIVGLYAARPDTARGREKLSEHYEDVLDGADLIHLLERDLMAPLDRNARSMVMGSAKRVSVVTAVSPRALVDVAFVLYENMRLIRRISAHYGGRPGAISSMRLAKNVLTHLAATGAIAVGDGLLQQVIGHGVAAKLSARFGEGVLNGLLTARIGIAAIDVCRPLPFDEEKRPGIRDFLGGLTDLGKTHEEK